MNNIVDWVDVCREFESQQKQINELKEELRQFKENYNYIVRILNNMRPLN